MMPDSALHIGIVNAMPDAALRRTEEQFIALLSRAALVSPCMDGASGDSATETEPAPDEIVGFLVPRPDPPPGVQFQLYSLPGVARGIVGTTHLTGAGYRPIEHLWHQPPDVLVLTGTEPRAADLRAEPYWDALTALIDWAEDQAIPTLFSCLSAHAAVLHLDAIARQPLACKCFGVFEQTISPDHPLGRGVTTRLWLPHSRWNALPETALRTAGYHLLSHSAQGGVGFFTRARDALWLFSQGHPEYDGANLLREYRRDIGRFLNGERNDYPPLPVGYFGAEQIRRLLAFQQWATARGAADALAAFPTVPPSPVWDTWRAAAVRIVRNWLDDALRLRPPVAARPTAQHRLTGATL